MADKKVLVTGMSGLIGQAVRREMEARGGYTLSALNRSKVEGVECHQGDISDLEAIRPAFTGVDAVIHLAAIAQADMTWKEILPYNVVGTYNVYEAARQAGVKRVVFASSGATVSGWETEEPYKSLAEGRYDDLTRGWPMIDHTSPTRPGGVYGASKVWGESLGRHFADTTDLSVICLRIGRVTEADKPADARARSVFCSRNDIARLLVACMEAPAHLKYDIFFGVSNNKWSYRDMSHAKAMLGFEPQDSADDR